MVQWEHLIIGRFDTVTDPRTKGQVGERMWQGEMGVKGVFRQRVKHMQKPMEVEDWRFKKLKEDQQRDRR